MCDLSYYKLSKTKLQETLKNEQLAKCLVSSIQFHKPSNSKAVLNLCSQTYPFSILHLIIVKLIHDNDICGNAQIDEAILLTKEYKDLFDTAQVTSFEDASAFVYSRLPLIQIKQRCGVGLTLSNDEINQFINQVILKNPQVVNIKPLILRELRNHKIFRFANIPSIMKNIDAAINERPVAESNQPTPDTSNPLAFLLEGDIAKLHLPGQNPQIDNKLMQKHLEQTKGKVVTRFPPEPNGFLHIGHAKAININFGYAKVHDGICYLRYDDTNPEAEEQVYIDGILQMVKWLGFNPFKITHSSDNFDALYELAVKLIKIDKAYVSHDSATEMHEQRGGELKGARFDSKFRNRPVSESLIEFNKMKNNQYKPGEAILRLKMDMQSNNPYFWDPVAYRIIHKSHPNTGNKWVIYPTYDFTHPICDSIENITHSLCTTEFVHARESYYWLLDQLKLYKPVQWEYGRLNITGTLTSKRKVAEIVKSNRINWDDPRLFTLIALRRRGILACSINQFVRQLGVTTALTVIEQNRFDKVVRDDLNRSSTRCYALDDPIKISLVNLNGDSSLPSTIYINRCDFNATADESFYRLRLGHSCGLLQVKYSITCIRCSGDFLECRYDDPSLHNPCPDIPYSKPKSYIQWLTNDNKLNVLINNYQYSNNSTGLVELVRCNGFMDKTPLLELIRKNKNCKSYKPCTGIAMDENYAFVENLKFQFVRIGYYQVDPSSDFSCLFKNEKMVEKWEQELQNCTLVVNKTVDLKEDTKKEQ
eukprot:NODE_515_length_7357_cov_0.487875.p1 type:complete len:762 gc:universal NODE_515_length_7357_cov_0.487875:6378-4093(-)